jgi:pimeloyl-ACP methyl ester carboxylesterase
MHDVLGHDRYAVAGGDFGSTTAAYLAHAHAGHLIGAHMTYPALLGQDADAFLPEKYSADEAGWFEANLERAAVISAHSVVQVGDPSSLAYGLNDSPAGLAGWLLSRRYALSDHSGDIEDIYTKDDLCRLLSIYWMTGTIGSSIRFYAETLRNADEFYRLPLVDDTLPILKAPVGVAVFPREVFRAPRASLEKYANLKRWTVMPQGGHYAPFEQPQLWAADVREFFATL